MTFLPETAGVDVFCWTSAFFQASIGAGRQFRAVTCQVPWKESDDEASESEASSEEDHPPLSLMSGSTARIVGLKKAGKGKSREKKNKRKSFLQAGAEQFNGQTLGFT